MRLATSRFSFVLNLIKLSKSTDITYAWQHFSKGVMLTKSVKDVKGGVRGVYESEI